MIVGIEGNVVKKEPTFVHIKTAAGLTYQVSVSLHCSAKIESEMLALHITQVIKEDSQNLYGFLEINEKIMFERVIKINGVGPSTALAICSTFTPESFSSAVAAQDINQIKMVPGIGPKSAKRILVELGDFNLNVESDQISSTKKEALMALESLGFKKDTINKTLSSCSAQTTSELIKEALKKLSR